MEELEEEVINRFISHYGVPDRKEEKLIRESTQWAIQEYLDSENFKLWLQEADFMRDMSNIRKGIWWLKFFRTTINFVVYAVIVYFTYKLVIHVF